MCNIRLMQVLVLSFHFLNISEWCANFSVTRLSYIMYDLSSRYRRKFQISTIGDSIVTHDFSMQNKFLNVSVIVEPQLMGRRKARWSKAVSTCARRAIAASSVLTVAKGFCGRRVVDDRQIERILGCFAAP
jgi:hypothetical protein